MGVRTQNYVHFLIIGKVDGTMHSTPHADSIHSDDVYLSALMRVCFSISFACIYEGIEKPQPKGGGRGVNASSVHLPLP